jgi:diaminopropionate ammonia-lyase
MPLKIVQNPAVLAPDAEFPEDVLSDEAADRARREIASWPTYAATPLHSLQLIATANSVARIIYKDESRRLGLNSFKALGGAHAVARLVQRRIQAEVGQTVSTAQLASGAHRGIAHSLTVICATDGNHGRSVAAGAALVGCRCVILLHPGVSEARAASIAAEGADVRRVPGDFDDAAKQAARMSVENDWALIADTSSYGGEAACRDVMSGYTVLASEVLDQIAEADHAPPTHVFVQAGVGGLAAAVTWRLRRALGKRAPTIVVVEPERADPLFQSAMSGRPTPSSGDLETVMAGLACGEVSNLAWTILEKGAAFFMTIPDAEGIAAMRLQADEAQVGQRIVAGESAGAGLAGFLAAAADPVARGALGLSAASRVLVIGTEGATDPAAYAALVGRAPVLAVGGQP